MNTPKGAGARNTDALHMLALDPRASANASRSAAGETTCTVEVVEAVYTAWRDATTEWEMLPRPLPGYRDLVREQLDAASNATARAVFLHGLDADRAAAVLGQLADAITAAQRRRACRRHPSTRRRRLALVQSSDPWSPGWSGDE